jgi:hypothetical protein
MRPVAPSGRKEKRDYHNLNGVPLNLAQSLIASGGWISLACFAAFTPTPVGARDGVALSHDLELKYLERIWPPKTYPRPFSILIP